MKKIAVACENNLISDHFGFCKHFTIYSVEDGKITNVATLKNPGHRPCTLPEYVAANGIHTIITGNMGKAAVDHFKNYGIDVILGAKGDSQEAVKCYLEGSLVSSDDYCTSWICEFFHE